MMKNIHSVWQQKKWKLILAASILTAGTAPALLSPHVVEAATNHKPTAYINNIPASYDVVIRQGVTYVALTELQFLGNYTFGYNNKTKEISIQTDRDKYILAPNTKTITKNGQTATLAAAPILVNGKAMLPLRAIGDAFGAQVSWNQAAKEAYIYQTDTALVKAYNGNDLVTAREAAIHLPRFSKLGQPRLELREERGDVDSTTAYIFEQGKKDRFFINENNNLISYYEVKNGQALLKWQANLGNGSGTLGDLFFVKTKPYAEAGTRPSLAGKTIVSFRYSLMAEETSYTVTNKAGSVAEGAAVPSKGSIFVNVPDEK
ncbi:hypothetical protein ASD24_20350 [Paenibacillus sp. Root52]|uniref:Copper amine oxidase-like N-terminal domain-containing protein n=2 Tax=Paenibacillus amylolyticus TaxID=1451 RepID=A0AAP5LST6_PAEAM|nr:copper amine oxidase N-terminal domain-containing protein [Paenibacillus sp. Root52]KQY93525.1 hypothetical protein ASD24_20350 [Paenibacillus sp. Root52]MDR6725914.1 hypothetical protein [Paenibacillus amylolyticus]